MNAVLSQKEAALTGIALKSPIESRFSGILTPGALNFLQALHEQFFEERLTLLKRRKKRQEELDAGIFPDFLPETKAIREGSWTCSPFPDEIKDRRVEITGPVDRKMVINALNSGASVFMADFEDSCSPTWHNLMDGQINLMDAIKRDISFKNPDTQKMYRLGENPAILFVRPRGWHLEERHILFNDQPTSASLVDFGLFFYHNINTLINRGSRPYFYLPKLESHLEARLWDKVFRFAQTWFNIPVGTIKATVLIETILAAFEMDEILYELREHSAGLNCGRWDYIFSFIKKFKAHPGFVLPDRSTVTMEVPMMQAYAKLLIKTCHKRKVHAIGGMSAFIPVKSLNGTHEQALDQVRKDKSREVKLGHDGSWVAHPGLVSMVRELFDLHMPESNQIEVQINDVITKEMLLTCPEAIVTEKGVRTNLQVGILYLESWLRGYGAVAIHQLMEDAATAEISRSQLWQWLHHQVKLSDGRIINQELLEAMLLEEVDQIRQLVGDGPFWNGKFSDAINLMKELIFNNAYVDFLTLHAASQLD